MRWTLAILPEIARGPHNALAKVMLPNAIRHHARCQRVFRARDPSGQREAPSAGGKLPIPIRFQHGRFGVTGNRCRESRFYGLARLQVVATNQNLGWSEKRSGRRPRDVRSNQCFGTPTDLATLQNVEAARKLRVAVLLFQSEDGVRCILLLNLCAYIFDSQGFKSAGRINSS